jgi:vancomycin resistance protein YoaR
MLSRLRHHAHHEPPAWLLITAIIFFIFLVGAGASYWVFNSNYKDKVYPGVFVGSINLSGLTKDEAFSRLGTVVDQYNKDGIKLTFKTKSVSLTPNLSSESNETVKSLIDFDLDKTAQRAINYGRERDFLTNAIYKVNALFGWHVIAPNYAINDKAVSSFIDENFAKTLNLSENAKLVFKNGEFIIEPEKSGYAFENEKAIAALETLISSMQTGEVVLKAQEKKAQITASMLSAIAPQANRQLALGELTLEYKTKKFRVKESDLGYWLNVELKNEEPVLILNEETTLKYLTDKISPSIEIKLVDARFIMRNGKATAFAKAKDGLIIDATSTLSNISNDWLASGLSSSSIVMKTVKSQTASSSETNDLGISELIGVGTSNFTGSPANRRHNIRIGMSYLNGLLIAPGETFSVMKHLGTIDASKGYLEELVIKKDKTQKEYGGGLCQVGTTMFRAALNTGLPILERRNHSYRVGYYEPAGTDATLYDPSPDLKFKNDTSNYVLIQGYVSGNKLSFEFWGTKDGRKVTQTYPKIYNIVKPAPAKIVETLTLKPGVKKCTEKAHNGADASFNYKVEYQGGETKSKQFNSHYVPWQEVCLIGVKSLNASSSAININTAGSANSTTTSATSVPKAETTNTTPTPVITSSNTLQPVPTASTTKN